jgi:hypothetical protein
MFTGERIAKLAKDCADRKLSPVELKRIAFMLPLIASSLFILELEIKHGIQIPV